MLLLTGLPADAPTAAQTPGTRKPGPFENLVPTPNPAAGPDQVDAADNPQWRRAMREKYEDKFPGPAPRTPDGKPDLNGVRVAQFTFERPSLTPSALRVLDDRFKKELKDYPYSVCLPPRPFPSDGPGPWLVMQNRTHLVTVFELTPNYRQVFLDGRPHPPELEPVEVTYEDPETFVTPWKVVARLFLTPGENLMENLCNENTKFPQLSAGQNP